jgi:hypothetical protein
MKPANTIITENPEGLRNPNGNTKPAKIILFFTGILLYHILMTFQGLDLLDEGFHVTFYQQFFEDPESVQYSFFYWFSGLIGGLVLKIFPGGGLWGLRLAGAITSTITIWIAFQLLKNYLNRQILFISLVVLSLFINTEPKDLYYNNLSALLYFTGGYLLFKGLIKNRSVFLFLSGAVFCINIFTRTPNLLGLGLGVLIFYHAWLYTEARKLIWKKMLFFAAGVITGLGLVVLVMHLLGHLDYFINSIKYLSAMSSTTNKKDGLGGGYGMIKLIYIPIKQYSMAIGSVLLILSFIFTGAYLLSILNTYKGPGKKLIQFIPFVFLLAVFGLIATDKIKINMLLYFLTGLSLFFGFLTIIKSPDRELKILSALGCLIILVHPFGSAPGIITVVIYSMWISFPIAADSIHSLKRIANNMEFETENSKGAVWLILTNRQLRNIQIGALAAILYLCIHHIFTYPYFYDYHKRSEMTWQVENKNMRHIYTSKERAGAINELLRESSKYIKEKDFVLAYDAIPLYHFMTETRPFLNNPSPMFYSTELFASEMEKATQKRPLPVIIQQKIKTVHEGSKWPEEIVQYNEEDIERAAGRNLYLESFIEKHGYKEVWSNKVFSISIPGEGKESNSTFK